METSEVVARYQLLTPGECEQVIAYAHAKRKEVTSAAIEFPIAVQAWVNIYEDGEGIILHNHWGMRGQSFSANVFLGGPTAPGAIYCVPDTEARDRPVFENVVVENRVGEMHVFDSHVYHMVPTRESKEPRYSIGMSIHSYWVASTRGVLSTLDEASRGFESNHLFLN